MFHHGVLQQSADTAFCYRPPNEVTYGSGSKANSFATSTDNAMVPSLTR